MSCPLPARRPPVASTWPSAVSLFSDSHRKSLASPNALSSAVLSLSSLALSPLFLFLFSSSPPPLFHPSSSPSPHLLALSTLSTLSTFYPLPSTLYPLPTRSRLPKSSQCYPYKRYTIAISGDATPGLVSASPDGRPPLQRYHPTITLSRQQQRPVPPPSTAPFSPPTTNFLPPFPPGHKTHTHARNGKRPRQHTSTQLPPNCLAALATRAAAIRFV